MLEKSIMRVVKKSEEEVLVTWNLLRSFKAKNDPPQKRRVILPLYFTQ